MPVAAARFIAEPAVTATAGAWIKVLASKVFKNEP